MELTDHQHKVSELFQSLSPYAMRKTTELEQSSTRLVHYTSAANAISIVTKRNIWMRRASEMNDYSEIRHGTRCLSAAWNHPVQGNRFQALLNSINLDLSAEIAREFSSQDLNRLNDTYLLSLSEHGNPTFNEDEYGRLSMWRAYGGDTNVALVINKGPAVRESNALGAFTTPVLYCDEESFIDHFRTVADALEQNLSAAKELGTHYVKHLITHIFNLAAVSSKHIGFSEEREWRVVYSPQQNPNARMISDIEVVGGVPQRVFKLPLTDYPEDGLTGMAPAELLEEVIIGPTQSGYAIYDALVQALSDSGVKDAEGKVKISGIPLRK